jgi:asparagine synthase (glutamine-hydrolysing)
VRGEFDGQSDLDRALHYDLNMLLPFCYNVKVDVTSMMSSLEVRCPFQDREVVEWAARIDPALKMRLWESKYLLKRAAVRRLPRDVIYRPKHGFSIPLDDWMRGSWAPAAHEIVLGREARRRGLFNYDYIEQLWAEHQAGVARHGTRFWLLLWLELWHRLFIDRSLTPSDELPSP